MMIKKTDPDGTRWVGGVRVRTLDLQSLTFKVRPHCAG